jgi:phospholipase C
MKNYLMCALLAVSFAGCSSAIENGAPLPSSVLPATDPAASTAVSPIKHIIVVVQENRSFNNIFAGYPGSYSSTFGTAHDGSVIALRPTTFVNPPFEMSGTYSQLEAIADWDSGKMDGFDLARNYLGRSAGKFAYAYLQRSLVKPYWAMANQYVLADHMFASQWGGSFTSHLSLIAGSALLSPTTAIADAPSAVPWGCDAPPGTVTATYASDGSYSATGGPFPCFDQSNSAFGSKTIADALDGAHVSWKYYAPPLISSGGEVWTAFDAIKSVACPNYPGCSTRGLDWQFISTPQTNVLTDISKNALPSVSWVIPDFTDSDHPGSNSNTGPSWVATVVNAVGKTALWKSTAIIVLWDDWGGFYDNLAPPQYGFSGLGLRVPCLIVSPYARPHYVSHTQYEFGSVLKFIEQTFNVPSLGSTDVRANSLVDTLDFRAAPRRFVPIVAPYPASHFQREKSSLRPPDND